MKIKEILFFTGIDDAEYYLEDLPDEKRNNFKTHASTHRYTPETGMCLLFT